MDAQLEQILKDFASKDPEVRKQAAARLTEAAESELTEKQCTRLLQAASRKWVVDDDIDPCDRLIKTVFGQSHAVDWKLIVVDFGHYSHGARWTVKSELESRGDVPSAEIFVSLIDQYADRNLIGPIGSYTNFLNSPEATKKLLPTLMSHAKPDDFGYYARFFALNAADKGFVTETDLAPFAAASVEMYRPIRERMRHQEQPEGDDWIWTEKYQEDRADATLLLDLMGHLPLDTVRVELTEALTSRDPALQHYGAKGLLAQRQDVPREAIEQIASNAEYHNSFFAFLEKIGRTELMPAKYLEQEYFAKSDMVNWLTHPAELGRPPHEIELMTTFDSENGAERYYLFRFRSHEPHPAAVDGWMAGLSGPFRIGTTWKKRTASETFSNFTKWDEKTPEEHFDAITGLLKKSRQNDLLWPLLESAEAAEEGQ